MKRSKVFTAVTAGVVAALALAACSSNAPSTTSPTPSPTTAGPTSPAVSPTSPAVGPTSPATDTGTAAATGGGATGTDIPAPTTASKAYNLAFIQGVTGDNFYITMQCGIQTEAARLGVHVTTQGPSKFDPTLQKPVLDSVVQAKPDAILIAPTDTTAMEAPLQQAAQNSKIVLVDTTVNDPSFAVSQIASDNIGGGKAAFQAIQQAHPAPGKVLVISVDPGISTTDQRAQGFEDAAKAAGFTDLGVQYSHNDPATAASLVTAALQKDPDIVGIFAANLFAAEGTATGIQQAGKKGQITVVGFDAGPDQVKALKDGTVQALVAQQPALIGKYGVDQAVAALDGGTITPKIQTGFSIITPSNVDSSDSLYVAKC